MIKEFATKKAIGILLGIVVGFLEDNKDKLLEATHEKLKELNKPLPDNVEESAVELQFDLVEAAYNWVLNILKALG